MGIRAAREERQRLGQRERRGRARAQKMRAGCSDTVLDISSDRPPFSAGCTANWQVQTAYQSCTFKTVMSYTIGESSRELQCTATRVDTCLLSVYACVYLLCTVPVVCAYARARALRLVPLALLTVLHCSIPLHHAGGVMGAVFGLFMAGMETSVPQVQQTPGGKAVSQMGSREIQVETFRVSRRARVLTYAPMCVCA